MQYLLICALGFRAGVLYVPLKVLIHFQWFHIISLVKIDDALK